jgi:glutathione synthase/RimK-type ligase-like ATP-grasp enzyme
MILIVTVAGDLHALVIQRALRMGGYSNCFIVECDRVAQREALSFGLNCEIADRLLTSEGRHVSVADASIIWFRTMRLHQLLDNEVDSPDARVIVDNDCRGGLMGLLLTQFRGKWISTPEATQRASDKTLQLDVALRCGFRVPKTLITQSVDDLKRFWEDCGQRVIAKTLVGAPGPFLETTLIDDLRSLDRESVEAAPTMFQEYVPGTAHLRINTFGSRSYAALIESPQVDWRTNLNVPISAVDVEPSIHTRIQSVLRALDLEMGVVDIKLTPAGEPVWLEVNPQGQFLFLDALTSLRVADNFAAFLLEQQSIMSTQG